MVYINEAHAADVWNIGMSAGTINYSHKNLDDRVECINKFIETFNVPFPVFSDCFDLANSFETIFASWPFRFYCFEGNVIKNIGAPANSTFELDPIFDLVNGK